jgi:hypothetical protein
MELKDYARAIRNHDWSACMSDSYAVTRRADARKEELADLAKKGKAYARLWDLGRALEGNFMWSAPSERWPEDKRHEDGWRWVGAYLWAHGIVLTEKEAKLLVNPMGMLDKYGRHLTGYPKWDVIDLLVKVHEAK